MCRVKKRFLLSFLLLVLILINTVPAYAQNSREAGKAIWIGDHNASDDNDGSDINHAVYSFNRAKELATADKSIKTIYLNTYLNVNGDLSLEGTNAVIKRAPAYTGYLFYVPKKWTTNLKNIVIDGNADNVNNIANTMFLVDGTLNIGKSTVLKNNKITDNTGDFALGGAIYARNGIVNISGGEISNNSSASGGAIYLEKKSSLNISDGIIKENLAKKGGGIYAKTSKITQNGGIISNNSATYGAGIYVFFSNIKNNSPILLNGGQIKQNKAQIGAGIYSSYSDISIKNLKISDNISDQFGGGIYVFRSTLDTTDTEISNNIANYGGGVCLYNDSKYIMHSGKINNNNSKEIGGGGISLLGDGTKQNELPCSLLINGGIIDNNTSKIGGGIFINHFKSDDKNTTNIATINACTISNNSSTDANQFGGGGIYVNGKNAKGWNNGILKLNYSLITNNTAKENGGGYAACPSSKSQVNLKYGSAIYANSVKNKYNFARDIYIVGGHFSTEHSGHAPYNISPIMLGGTPYNWKLYNGQEAFLNNLEGQLKTDKTRQVNDLGLHTDVKDDKNAKRLAKVIITANSSASNGGGIGSNGTVIMGEYDYAKIKVSKIWKNANKDKLPKYVLVNLFKKSDADKNYVYMGCQFLKATNDDIWTATFENLPKTDSNNNEIKYLVSEREEENSQITINDISYHVSYEGSMKDGFKITNSQNNTKITNYPKTGDTYNIYTYLSMLAISCVSIIIFINKKYISKNQ